MADFANGAASILKNIAIIVFVVAAMAGVGLLMNRFVPWDYLSILFMMVRDLISPFDFIWNTDLTIVLVGISFAIEAGIWSIRAIIAFLKISGLSK